MANFINDDYFIRDINLPLNNEEDITKLNSYIEKYQEDVLIMALGYDLYSKFIIDPEAEQRFKDIRDGKEFEFDFCGKLVKRKYIGLANTQKESLIAYYTYFFLVSNNVTFTSTTGEIKPDNENSNQASPNQKLMRSWNKFVDLTGNVFDDKLSFYWDGWFNQFDLSSYQHVNAAPSLFNFLLANKDVYPEWEFQPSEKINIFAV